MIWIATPKKDDDNDTLEKRLWTAADQLRANSGLTSQRSLAQVMGAIQDTLGDELPKPYTKDIYERKVSAVFEHVYESYQGEGASVYGG